MTTIGKQLCWQRIVFYLMMVCLIAVDTESAAIPSFPYRILSRASSRFVSLVGESREVRAFSDMEDASVFNVQYLSPMTGPDATASVTIGSQQYPNHYLSFDPHNGALRVAEETNPTTFRLSLVDQLHFQLVASVTFPCDPPSPSPSAPPPPPSSGNQEDGDSEETAAPCELVTRECAVAFHVLNGTAIGCLEQTGENTETQELRFDQ